MNTKKLLNIAFIFAVILSAFTAVFAGGVPVKADHGRTVVQCEEFYRGSDEMDLCIEHARVDSAFENCQSIPNDEAMKECEDAIVPASDGYDGTTPAPPPGAGVGSQADGSSSLTEPTLNGGTENCGGVDIAVGVGCDPNADNPITGYANAIINFLAGGVGLVVIIMVATGGVQFMLAGGNPQATQAAIKRISDALIGLLFFILLYAFLQWVIPGGPF